MQKRIHSVKYNFVMNFILTASQFLFPLVTFPYVSRVLQASGNGKISFATSVANYFLMIASLGIPTYGVRACAKVRDDIKQLSKTAQEIFIINFVMTMFVSITYILCIITIPRLHRDALLFYINGINIVLNMFGMNWLFQALEQYDYITFRSLLFKIISLLLMFLLVHKENDYIIYGAIIVFAATGSNILNFARAIRIIDFKIQGQYDLKRHFKPIFVLFAQSLAVSIYTNLDTVMLGFMKGDKAVGYYNAAVKIKTILLSLVTSLGNVLLPRMSYYAKKGLKRNFIDMMQKSLNFTLLMSISLSVYFVLFAQESILFLAGEGYSGAIRAMQIITIAVIPNGLTAVLGIQVLTAIEKEKCVLYSVIVGASVDLVLNIMLIPKYGAAGAALATTIAEFSVLIVQCAYTKNYLSEIRKGIRIKLYIFASVIGTLCVNFWEFEKIKSSFLSLCLSAIIYFGVYAIVLLIGKEELVVEVYNNIKKIFCRK